MRQSVGISDLRISKAVSNGTVGMASRAIRQQARDRAVLPCLSFTIGSLARIPDQGKCSDGGASNAVRRASHTDQVRWPRFDPNVPGDLERAVKEARRIQAEQAAHKAREQELDGSKT